MSQLERIATPVETAIAPAHRAWDRAALTWPAVMELTKPRITRLVMVTTAVGFCLPATARSWTLGELLATAFFAVAGAGLSAAGANALNHWLERSRDSLMHRTRTRPLPSGRLSAGGGLAAGILFSLAGVGVLLLLVNAAAAAVSAATILTYILLYTPLKPVTPLATIVGAVPGALPPLIGWAAAAGYGSGDAAWRSLADPAGWSLFLVMFVWQVPHFLAIAWMHRADYARGGHAVLPVLDPTGTRTARASLLWAVALVPASLAPVALMPETLGWLSAAAAIVLGAAFVVATARFAARRTDAAARAAFIASIIYLPAVFAAMVADAVAGVVFGAGGA